MARDGEHIGETWKLLNITPREAIASMCGVRISLPYAPKSENPTSSATTTTTFGREATGVAGSAAIDLGANRAVTVVKAAAIAMNPAARRDEAA